MVVKKYGNRRLYDTSESRYITLEELAARVRAGADARVVDAKTDEDLTQVTLTQIILEGKRAARLLPVPLLLQLIRMGDDDLAEFFSRYMTWALKLYQRAKQGAEAISPYNPFAMAPFDATNALARLLSGGGFNEPPPPPPAVAPPAQAAVSDVADLRRELEALKKSVAQGQKRRR